MSLNPSSSFLLAPQCQSLPPCRPVPCSKKSDRDKKWQETHNSTQEGGSRRRGCGKLQATGQCLVLTWHGRSYPIPLALVSSFFKGDLKKKKKNSIVLETSWFVKLVGQIFCFCFWFYFNSDWVIQKPIHESNECQKLLGCNSWCEVTIVQIWEHWS